MNRFALLASAGAVIGFLVAVLPTDSEAGERVFCSITMPTDAGSASTAAQQSDAGCTVLDDGGVENCTVSATCSWGKGQNLFVQCDNPVYYSETPASTVNNLNQREVRAATSGDVLIDFDANPDPYRINLRGQSQHISLLSTSTSANTCKVGTIERHVP